MSTYGAPYVQWRTEGGGQLPLGAAPRGAPKRGGKKKSISERESICQWGVGGRAPIVCLPPGADYPQYATEYVGTISTFISCLIRVNRLFHCRPPKADSLLMGKLCISRRG